MANFIMTHEPAIRLAAFAGVLAAVALWEALRPKRPRLFSRWRRWPSNLAIVALNSAVARALLPLTAVALATLGQQRGWGLLNNVGLDGALKIVIAVVALDLVIYFQHVLFHAAPALWRLHRMHHADLDFDVTTGARFHPGEIILSAGLKLAAIAALGASPLAVLIFEVLLNATAMFNHANAGLPKGVDRVLRWIVVTPDMHRVHHSILPQETNSNFGFNLPWWDRLFGTYRAAPAMGHEGMTIGLTEFRDPAQLRLDRLLTQPLVEAKDEVTIGRRK